MPPPLPSPSGSGAAARRCRGKLLLPAAPRGRQAGFGPSWTADGEVRGPVGFPSLGMKRENQEHFACAPSAFLVCGHPGWSGEVR